MREAAQRHNSVLGHANNTTAATDLGAGGGHGFHFAVLVLQGMITEAKQNQGVRPNITLGTAVRVN